MLQLVLRGDLFERVPRADPTTNRGVMEKVDQLPGDIGYRWTHLYQLKVERPGKAPKPISFDAGACALWCSPLGWRVLGCWQHDDPTYGLNLVVFDPWGDAYAQVKECGAPYSWLDANLP